MGETGPAEGAGTMFQVVTRHAHSRPGARAMSGANRTWTYGTLVDAAEQAAGVLQSFGLAAGDRFAVVADNDPLTCIAWLAGSRVGIVPCIVNSRLAVPELARLLAHLRPGLVLTDAVHDADVRAAERATTVDFTIATLSSLESDGADAKGAPHPATDEPFEITYTSGTTSDPKGVVLTHRAELAQLADQQDFLGVGADDVAYAVTPLFHASGIRNSVALMWFVGGHVHIAPRFSASRFFQEAAAVGATYACFVETLARLLMLQPPSPAEREHTIRVALGGGTARGTAEFVEAVEARFGFRTTHVFGMTECGPVCGVPLDLDPERLHAARRWRPSASLAGWPLGGCEVRVVDDDGNDVAEGGTGQIVVRSDGLFSGYFDNPRATAAALHDGWLHTGDLAAVGPDRCLYFVGRSRDVIRRGGESFASREIEQVLDAHPDVARSAAFGLPDELWGEVPKVVVVPEAGRVVTAEDVWTWCDDRLADFKVPRYVEFRDSLPENASGRVLKHVLRDDLRDDATTFERMESRS